MSVIEKPAAKRRKLSKGAKAGIVAGAVVVALAFIGLGSKFIPVDDPLLVGTQEFDPETFGAETFPTVQENAIERAVDAEELAAALIADPAAAAEEYAVESSGGPVYTVKLTGVFGEAQSNAYDVIAEGVPENITVRVQTGPAINGTALRDATGDVPYGDFTNQIEYQDAATALNEEMKATVLADIDTANLTGKTVTLTGAFTSVNPEMWLITPVEMDVQ